MDNRKEFDPNEILDDVTGTADTDFDILGDMPELTEEDPDKDLDELYAKWESERLEQERLEQERLVQERLEQEKIRLEQERLDRERQELLEAMQKKQRFTILCFVIVFVSVGLVTFELVNKRTSKNKDLKDRKKPKK